MSDNRPDAILEESELPLVQPDFRPLQRPDVGQTTVEGTLILGGELHSRTVTLDPVSAVIWEMLDGTVNLLEIAGEVAAAVGGDLAERGQQVSSLVALLASAGFIDNLVPIDVLTPRRVFPIAPLPTLLGKRLGVGDLTVRQIRSADGSSFRCASTIPDVLDDLAAFLDVEELDERPLDTLVLHDTQSSGSTSMLVLSDAMGNTMFTTRDRALGMEAFRRTAAARSSGPATAWIEAIAFQRGNRAVVVHPAFRESLVHLEQSVLDPLGVKLVPCGLLQMGPDGQVRIAADPVAGSPPLAWDLAGVVAPQGQDRVRRFQVLVDIAGRWDRVHFDLLAALDLDRDLHQFDERAKVRDLIDAIGQLCGGPSHRDPTLAEPHLPGRLPRAWDVSVVDAPQLALPPVIRVPDFMVPPPDVREFVRDQWLDFSEDGASYNVPIAGDCDGFFTELYDRFLDMSGNLLGPFSLSSKNSRTCFALCMNDLTRTLPFHTHAQTAHINGVYYLSIPRHDPGEGALVLDDRLGQTLDIEVNEHELLIFDALSPHAPRHVTSTDLRIAINMEILVDRPDEVGARFAGLGVGGRRARGAS